MNKVTKKNKGPIFREVYGMLCLYEVPENFTSQQVYDIIVQKMNTVGTDKIVCASHPKLSEEQEDALVDYREACWRKAIK